MAFENNYSWKSENYQQFRPRYPRELFEWLATITPSTGNAWDCATGNGQAAIALAEHFERVFATDGSEEQLSNAIPHERVTYTRALAESIPAPDASFDLVTVATAVHWFDLDRFYAEVRRVTVPGAAIAVWSYYAFETEPAIDTIVSEFVDNVIEPYWPVGMDINKARYKTLAFPFDAIEAPALEMKVKWPLQAMMGYLSTWSGIQKYFEKTGTNALDQIEGAVKEAWGDPERIVEFRWPLHIKAGRIHPPE